MENAASARSMAGWQPNTVPAREAPRESPSTGRSWAAGVYQVDSAIELIKLGQDRAKTSPIGQTAEDPGPRPRRLSNPPGRRRFARKKPRRRAPGKRDKKVHSIVAKSASLSKISTPPVAPSTPGQENFGTGPVAGPYGRILQIATSVPHERS